jgi:hypothetical protein
VVGANDQPLEPPADGEPIADKSRRPRIAGMADSRERFLNGPKDNAAACRERASADLESASERSTANGRRVLESSAASWTARADLLQRLEDKFEARKAERTEPEDEA